MNDEKKKLNIYDTTELQEEGVRVLVERLGVEGALLFLRRLVDTSGDYTRDRHMWLDKVAEELS